MAAEIASSRTFAPTDPYAYQYAQAGARWLIQQSKNSGYMRFCTHEATDLSQELRAGALALTDISSPAIASGIPGANAMFYSMGDV